MGEELFSRLKKMAKREGKVVFTDGDESFVVMSLDEYECLTDELCGEECECGCHGDLAEEVFTDGEKAGDEADKELIKRVNEDIAKWREEQARQEEKKAPVESPWSSTGQAAEPVNLDEVDAGAGKKDSALTEEERYYLEPLE